MVLPTFILPSWPALQRCQRCWFILLLSFGIFIVIMDLVLLEIISVEMTDIASSGSSDVSLSSEFHSTGQPPSQPQPQEESQDISPWRMGLHRLQQRQQNEQRKRQRHNQQQQQHHVRHFKGDENRPHKQRHNRFFEKLPSPSTMEFLNRVGLSDLYNRSNQPTSSDHPINDNDDTNFYSNTTLDHQVEFVQNHWHVIEQRMGGGPIIVGLDTCAKYRATVPIPQRILAPAGLFNSGTNLLSKLLYDNCWLTPMPPSLSQSSNGLVNQQQQQQRRRRNGQGLTTPKADHHHIHWQVNWGKHTPAYFRTNFSVYEDVSHRRFLPIVTTRDPYSWLQSLCRVRYSLHWFHHASEHCPNLVPNEIDRMWYHKVVYQHAIPYNKRDEPWLFDNLNDLANYTPDLDHVPVRVRFKASTLYFHNLVDVWNEWYKAYYDHYDSNIQDYQNHGDPSSSLLFPRLLIRLEDLVIYPQEVITKVCHCAGGQVVHPFRHVVDSAKVGDQNIHGTIKTNRLDAMMKLILENRTKGMTVDDFKFVQNRLNVDLLQAFQYQHPKEEIKGMSTTENDSELESVE